MPKDYSPFTPGSPVSNRLFTGREAELKRLIEKCEAAQSGRLECSYVLGERGIGKSSLVALLRDLAEHRYDMLCSHAHLGGAKDLGEMARRIFDGFAQSANGSDWGQTLKDLFKNHLRSVGLLGVSIEFTPPKQELAGLYRNLATEVLGILGRLGSSRNGALIILDDINGLAETPDFANWVKSFVDEVATRRLELPVHFVLVSTPDRRQQLIDHNPSVNRIFELCELEPLSRTEAGNFFSSAFSTVGVSVHPEALDILTGYSGGYPVIMHEIGEAVFRRVQIDQITDFDASMGLLDASRSVGRKYIEPEVMSAIRSEKYRSILRVVAGLSTGTEILRQEAREQLTEPERKVFDNFVRKMRDLGVLVEATDRGKYSFKHNLHRLYYMLEAASQEQEPNA